MRTPFLHRTARPVVLLLSIALIAACDAGAGPSPSAAPTGAPSPATSGLPTLAPTSELPSPSGATAQGSPPAVPSNVQALLPGMLAVTVTDGIRVRSDPRVADDSLRYTPLLRLGTQLVVAAGPVRASGYDWYRVAPIGVKLSNNADQGWVAVADHDGTPWVTPARDPTPGFELAASHVQLPTADLAAARTEAADINAFAVAMYKRLRSDAGSKGLVFSPASIVMALTMARAGANGETAAEMDRVLHAAGWGELSDGISSLDALLRSRDGTWTNDDESGGDGQTHELALRIANMAFAQEGYALQPDYLDRIGRTSGSGLGLVDYVSQTEAARQAINGWVSRQTMGRIPQLLAPNSVNVLTRLVLVNAVYLKAQWVVPFIEGETTPRVFTTLSGATIRVPTMSLYGGQSVALATGSGWAATELAYESKDGHPLAMTLILPDDLRAFERTMTPAKLSAVRTAIGAEQRRIAKVTYGSNPEDCGTYPYQVHLLMPRFGQDTRVDTMADTLAAMGMRLATNVDTADFSGITGKKDLFIAKVIHQANIDVDEKGTVAAAATAIIMDVGGCTGPEPARVRTLRLDQPFIYLLRDTQTGAILFMGRVTDPSQRS